MTPQKVLDKWDYRTPTERRKEVYERLMGQEEFGDFLMILKEWQDESYKYAQANPEESAFYLGAAEAIDRVRIDIDQVLSDAHAAG